MDHTSAAARAAHLRAELERHNQLYYQKARPEISDQQFDALLRELQDIEQLVLGDRQQWLSPGHG